MGIIEHHLQSISALNFLGLHLRTLQHQQAHRLLWRSYMSSPCYYCSNHPKFAIWRLAETSWTPCTASACQLSMEMELALVLGPGSLGVWWSSRCTMAWCSCWYAHSRWCTSSGWRGSQHHQQIFRDPTNLTQHEGQLADPAQCGRVILCLAFVICLRNAHADWMKCPNQFLMFLVCKQAHSRNNLAFISDQDFIFSFVKTMHISDKSICNWWRPTPIQR